MHILIDSDSDESSNHGDVVDDDDNPSCDNSAVEACNDKYLDNEKLFNKRYEEGYNIYSEPYAKWLLKHHPRETPTDWITRLEQGIIKWYQHTLCVWFKVSQNQKALKTAQCIVTVRWYPMAASKVT